MSNSGEVEEMKGVFKLSSRSQGDRGRWCASIVFSVASSYQLLQTALGTAFVSRNFLSIQYDLI